MGLLLTAVVQTALEKYGVVQARASPQFLGEQEIHVWWVGGHAQRVRVPLWVQGLECVEVLSVGL